MRFSWGWTESKKIALPVKLEWNVFMSSSEADEIITSR